MEIEEPLNPEEDEPIEEPQPQGQSPARVPVAISDLLMDFPAAMRAVINGLRVARQSWGNGDQVYLWNSRLVLKKSDGVHELLVSDGDMFGTDWIVVN